MSRVTQIAVAVLLAVAAFTIGRTTARREPTPTGSGEAGRRIVRWACPMHPQFTSDRPGNAPCCGMRLEPVYDTQGVAQPMALARGEVMVDGARQQAVGVQIGEVSAAATTHVLRAPARIAPDEARVYRLVAAADGWIRRLNDNSAGVMVDKDELLASYYVPNLLASQQGVLYTMRATDTNRTDVAAGTQQPAQIAPTTLALQNAIDGLRSLGMSDMQLDEFRRTRTFADSIHIYSPIRGVVLARNLSPAQRFDKGAELYRIADVSRVWALADLFEADRALLKPGAIATVRYQGRSYPARMSNVLPQLDPTSRTLKTRFELDNPGNVLRPDAFVELEIELRFPSAITIPADAIVDSGRQKTVFVSRGKGVFEPRAVETGWRLGGRVEITRGLAAGESIVTAGNFLIDSESRMKGGAPTAPPPALPSSSAATVKDPICGMDVHPSAPGVLSSRHNGVAFYFCSESCKAKFDSNSDRSGMKSRAGGAAHRGSE